MSQDIFLWICIIFGMSIKYLRTRAIIQNIFYPSSIVHFDHLNTQKKIENKIKELVYLILIV